jgi:hypothetical protein
MADRGSQVDVCEWSMHMRFMIKFDIFPSILSAMAQNPTPELYLSLLSGQYSDMLHISMEQCHNNVGPHISGKLFFKDPDLD